MSQHEQVIETAKAALGLSAGGGIPSLVHDLSQIHPGSPILQRLADALASGQVVGSVPSQPAALELPQPRDAVILLSKEIARLILKGTLAPLDGAEVIHAIAVQSWQEYPELGTFLFAALEADGRPEDRLQFEKAILDESRELVQD